MKILNQQIHIFFITTICLVIFICMNALNYVYLKNTTEDEYSKNLQRFVVNFKEGFDLNIYSASLGNLFKFSSKVTEQEFLGSIKNLTSQKMFSLEGVYWHAIDSNSDIRQEGLSPTYGYPTTSHFKYPRIPVSLIKRIITQDGVYAHQTHKRNGQFIQTYLKPIYRDQKLIGILRFDSNVSKTLSGIYNQYFNRESDSLSVYVNNKAVIKIPSLLNQQKIMSSSLEITHLNIPFKFELNTFAPKAPFAFLHYINWFTSLLSAILCGALASYAIYMVRKRYQYQQEFIQRSNELSRTNKELEETSKYKSLFLANMSHEIRTPLNAITGMASLLQDTPLDVQQKSYLSAIEDSSNNLLVLVNDILDFSKIEADKIELDHYTFSIEDIVQKSASMFATLADEKSVSIISYIDPALSKTFWNGDPVRIQQILNNLISNAVKFTNNGTISIYANLGRIIDDNKYMVSFSVQDTGMGISEDKLTNIFNRFEQEDPSATRKAQGTGLGLSICKKLVELMGGEIKVSSRKGEGTEFTIHVVIEQSPQKPNLILTYESYQSVVYSSNHLVCTNLNFISEQLNISTEPYQHAQSAEAALKNMTSSKKTILIYHAQNDLELALLSRLSELAQYTIIIDSTRNLNHSSLQSLKGTCRLAYLPFTAKYLAETINNALYGTIDEEHKTKQKNKAVNMPKGKTVLVAEDALLNQKFITALLKKWGLEVILAEDGREAVSLTDEMRPDLILMDMQMPEMDGLEATRIIRSFEDSTAKTPIIALTANAFKKDAKQCLDAGMNAYLSKPINRDALEAELIKWLSTSRK